MAIDSGPAHLAATTTTPTLCLWKTTNPMQAFEPAANVTHAMPVGIENQLPALWREQAMGYFNEHYRVTRYAGTLDNWIKENGEQMLNTLLIQQ